MNTLLFLVEKEFRQIFRNPTLMAIILAVPVVQLLILPLTANYEVKDIRLAVVSHDASPDAQRLITSIGASGYFRLVGVHHSFPHALTHLESDVADLILEVPADFERDLVRGERMSLFIAVNAINGIKAGLGTAYLNTIIRDFNDQLRLATARAPGGETPPDLQVVATNWYNPYMRYQLFMVPGILAILVTMVGGYLSALNIVREKETGTIEQINVTPIRKHLFIIGKLIPFWIMGLVTFTLGMLVGWAVYGVTPVGSVAMLYGFVAVYLLSVLGLGLLISTFAETQQQAMFISFFFVMIFILMSGLFTPVESMPEWAQVISRLNPVTYFIEVMRMVVIKGSEWRHILPHFAAVIVFGVVLNAWAILNYKKVS